MQAVIAVPGLVAALLVAAVLAHRKLLFITSERRAFLALGRSAS
jgi:hypothetical protein